MRSTLDDLATRGAAALRDRNERFHVREGLPAILASLALVPLIVCLTQWVQSWSGSEPWRPSAWALMASMVATAVLVAWGIAWRARRGPVDRRAALGLFDRAVGADERLVTADALLRADADGPFARAAIVDAERFLKPAEAAEPTPPAAPEPTTRMGRGVLYALAGIALLVSALHPVTPRGSGRLAVETADEPYPTPELDGVVEVAEQQPADAPPPVERVPPSEAQPATNASDAAAPSKPSELPDEAMRKEGKAGAGRSAQAQGARGQNDAQGSPTQQGQQTPKPPTTKKPLAKKKKRTKKPRKPGDDKKPEQQKGQESGATAGRGSSRGSNKNAVTSDWKSKDQVTTDEDEDIEDDEEVEDEEVDSEARGGVQPNLRSRKPPVSRDLTIGFGNNPSPDANGRGGPSQPKKSRGTASLVLGVPIPDRIKGQPNPGKTKVTQERVEPRRERAPAATAEARTPRASPTGPLARPALEPWMQEMLRAWFLALREQEKNKR